MEIKSNLNGRRVGLLVVQGFSHDHNSHHYWNCLCDCGNTKVVRGSHLYTKAIKSCGCLIRRQGKDCPAFRGYEEISGDFLHSIRYGAKTRKIEYNLKSKYLWDLFIKQKRCCALSGVPLTFEGGSTENRYAATSKKTASLDRINSTRGYIEGNVQWIHKDLNWMKQSLDEPRFVEWCRKVADYSRLQKLQLSV